MVRDLGLSFFYRRERERARRRRRGVVRALISEILNLYGWTHAVVWILGSEIQTSNDKLPLPLPSKLTTFSVRSYYFYKIAIMTVDKYNDRALLVVGIDVIAPSALDC